MSTTIQTIKEDPGTAAIIALAVLLVALLAIRYGQSPTMALTIPLPQREDLRPPADWRKPGEFLRVPGHHVYYYGKPLGAKNPPGAYHRTVKYSSDTAKARPFQYVIFHYTAEKPRKTQAAYAKILARIQHYGECGKYRCGSFGYHFLVTRSGEILQTAPFSVRTNHIRARGSRTRSKRRLPDADNDNAIGVSAVGGWGACPGMAITANCAVWRATPAQENAMVAVAKALKKRFDIPCENVGGHGGVQPGSRNAIEGTALAKKMREACQ